MPYRILTASALLTTYLAATVLPAGSLVQCISTSGHAAIEFAHAACPDADGTRSSNEQRNAHSELVPGCMDIPLVLGAAQHRVEPAPSLSLQPTTLLAILPKPPTRHAHRDAARANSAQAQPTTDLLRTVVLVI